MATLQDVQQKHIRLMKLTAETIGHILKNVTHEQAISLHDGPEGWTIIEILCHLRDFDTIFRNRAHQMLEEDNPMLPAYDHEAMAKDSGYIEEDFAYAYDGFLQSREQTIAFFENLTEEQWQRVGIHPESGHFSMTHAVMQVGLHDMDHTEQITRILEQETPGSGGLPSEDLDVDS